MIKRRFYREEHGDRDEPSSDSSSASASDGADDSDVDADDTEESEDHAAAAEVKENEEPGLTSYGYESENSSAEEVDFDLSEGHMNEDDGTGKHGADILKKEFNGVPQKEFAQANMPDFVLKFKSVYRCRICPRVVCLSEEILRTHLNSKRHARSEKLLKENRLKAMLNSDGEIENQETPAEMHARIMALGQKSNKQNKGRQRQKKRSRKKKGQDVSNTEKTKGSMKTPAKKRHKRES